MSTSLLEAGAFCNTCRFAGLSVYFTRLLFSSHLFPSSSSNGELLDEICDKLQTSFDIRNVSPVLEFPWLIHSSHLKIRSTSSFSSVTAWSFSYKSREGPSSVFNQRIPWCPYSSRFQGFVILFVHYKYRSEERNFLLSNSKLSKSLFDYGQPSSASVWFKGWSLEGGCCDTGPPLLESKELEKEWRAYRIDIVINLW